MIPILIKSLVNWLSNNIRVVTVSIISLLVVTIFIQHKQLDKKNTEIERLFNNVKAYEQLVDTNGEKNRVLQLTINELKNSRDSLIQQIDSTKKELKIKDKNLKSANVINTVIRDTVRTVIKHKQIDFNETLKLNPLTIIKISRKDSILTAKLDITNQQILFVEEKKEYKRKYKNGWVRFWHFDFKKIRTRKYQIVNSNPLIKISDTRIIEVNN